MTYKEFQNALRILDLPSEASFKEIRAQHRALVKRHHPDRDRDDGGKIREINAAWDVIEHYCRTYRYVFSEENFYRQNPEERLRVQFDQGPFNP